MFTEDNTAKSTHVIPASLASEYTFIFYDLSNSGAAFLTMPSGLWVRSCHTSKGILHLPAIIELSRPQSDFDALFNDAPDWVTGYGRLKTHKSWRYWLSDKRYSEISGQGDYEFGLEDDDSHNFDEDEFVIIATRPPIDPDIESKPALLDENTDQAKISNIGNILHNMSCNMTDENEQEEFGEYASFCWSLADSFKDKPIGGEAKSKPVIEVYTQEVFLQSGKLGAWLPCEVIFVGRRHTIVRVINGREHCRKTAKIKLRDIDQRTDKEKACDSIWKVIDDSGKENDLREVMELAYDKWVGIEYTGN